MDEHTFETLELDALLDLLLRFVQSPVAQTQARALRPTADLATVRHAQTLTSECCALLNTGDRVDFSGVENPESSMAKLEIAGTSLEPKQVLAMERLVSSGLDLRRRFGNPEARRLYPNISALISPIPDLRRLFEIVKGKVHPSGDINEDASPELKALRKEAIVRRSRIHRSLESILKNQPKAMQEELVTFRNGRFVIPVRTDTRSQVPGVVHGLSSSGQTTYVEPISVMDQNNELVRIYEQEALEISRILFALSEALRADLPALRRVIAVISELDILQAKGSLAIELNCVQPQIAETGDLSVSEARHPLLDHALRRRGGRAVPISFDLDHRHNVLVISGPNAGGKTVALKTIGLIALMSQMGLHVPAREATLPVYQRIFSDIGDEQSIAANLSSFTAHMRNVAAMSRKIVEPSLLLIDEVGTGTDPDEGAALAIAIVDYLRRSGATTITTTHYNELKLWASQAEGVLNASVEFDVDTLQPTYRLIIGISGGSAGLEIARRMDVPLAILKAAETYLHPDHIRATAYLNRIKATLEEQERIRGLLSQEQSAAAERQQRMELEFARREAARRVEFEGILDRFAKEFKQDSALLIKSLKDRAVAEQIKKEAQRQVKRLQQKGKEKLTQAQGQLGWRPAGRQRDTSTEGPPVSTKPRIGDRVWIHGLKREGIVESVLADTYAVAVGALKYRADPEELQVLAPLDGTDDPKSTGAFAPELNVDLDDDFTLELNVIGLSADEATERIDKYIDDAYLRGIESVRIIHGYGKGVLRRAVAHLLSKHPQIESFAQAPADEGGGGAMRVFLKG